MVITYAFFATLIFAASAAALFSLLQNPFGVTFATYMLLALVVIAGILVAAGVAILKVGGDGCAFNP